MERPVASSRSGPAMQATTAVSMAWRMRALVALHGLVALREASGEVAEIDEVGRLAGIRGPRQSAARPRAAGRRGRRDLEIAGELRGQLGDGGLQIVELLQIGERERDFGRCV